MSNGVQLKESILNLNEKEVQSIVAQMIEENIPPQEILLSCHNAMAELGRRFEDGDCFIPELIIGGKIMENLMPQLQPLLQGRSGTRKTVGTIVMGTVQHDVHSIGKDIVAMILRGNGYNIIDLGVNVSPEKFVQAAQEHQAQAIGMSVLLTSCYPSVVHTVQALQQAELRDRISIMIGGAAATPMLAEKTSCDFYGKSAYDVMHFMQTAKKQVPQNANGG
jgi:5-methyltetrahydrofolate--homocysteine methyltransferase